MPLPAQFTFSFELTVLAKLAPVRTALSYDADAIVKLARDLKKTGSDFIVEEDLAAVFGRLRIEQSLEARFKDVVKIASFVPLHPEAR